MSWLSIVITAYYTTTLEGKHPKSHPKPSCFYVASYWDHQMEVSFAKSWIFQDPSIDRCPPFIARCPQHIDRCPPLEAKPTTTSMGRYPHQRVIFPSDCWGSQVVPNKTQHHWHPRSPWKASQSSKQSISNHWLIKFYSNDPNDPNESQWNTEVLNHQMFIHQLKMRGLLQKLAWRTRQIGQKQYN